MNTKKRKTEEWLEDIQYDIHQVKRNMQKGNTKNLDKFCDDIREKTNFIYEAKDAKILLELDKRDYVILKIICGSNSVNPEASERRD